MSTASAGAVVAVESLSRRFGATLAVDAVSFSVESGAIFGLVGPDGAGKTTIMRMLAGVMKPDGGRIVVDGVDAVADPESVKTHLSYMPQRFGLYEDLTVDENIRFYADLFEIPQRLREQRTLPLLEASNLIPFRRRLAGQLSGGMKQKLGLVCSLVHTPRILLLDEPTTGVDPISRRDFWRILYDLRESGVTILISTAYLDEAERCTRLALLHQGRLRYCDTPQALKARMPGALLVIPSNRARAARDAVAGLAGVMSVLLVGDGIHAVVDDHDKRIPEIQRALEAKRIPFGSIEQGVPSIEDLFVGLLRQEEPA
ncbi:MAG TPA: ABC transporter ATP-binding protein [Stellaceae bacterium]|nr:ABC transporter ATP-binding protein [Stellaceae bacterium]